MNPTPRQIDSRTALHQHITAAPPEQISTRMKRYLRPYYGRMVTGGTQPEIILSMSDGEVAEVLQTIETERAMRNRFLERFKKGHQQ